MAQHDRNIGNDTGANVRSDINSMAAAEVSRNSGSSAPATTFAYMPWADTTNGVMKRRNAANSAWVLEGTLAESKVISRTSDTELGIGDFERSFLASGTWTQTFDAVAALGDGWWVDFKNDGVGIITLDPDGSELIDGATSIALAPGESCRIVCNGAVLKSYGRNTGVIETLTAAATALLAFDSGIHPSLFSTVRFELFNVKPTTANLPFIMIVSVDGGSSYTSSGHLHVREIVTTAPAATPFGSASDSSILLASNPGSGTNDGISGWVEVQLTPMRATWHLNYMNNSGVFQESQGSARIVLGNINAVGFGFDSTTAASGSIVARGIRK